MPRGAMDYDHDSSMTGGEQVPDPETFAELLFRVEIELWEMFREIEADFQKLVDDTKAEFKRIHDELSES